MQKHVVFAIGILLMVGGLVVVLAPSITAAIQGIDPVFYEPLLKNVNTNISKAIGAKEIVVFKGSTDIKSGMTYIGNNGGSFLAFGNVDNLSRIYLFLRDAEDFGEIFVYKLGKDGYLYQMDCSGFMDGETDNIFDDGIIDDKPTFTTQEFLTYHNCTEYPGNELGEDVEGLIDYADSLKDTTTILKTTYTPDKFVDFSINPLIKVQEQTDAADPGQTDFTTAPEYTTIQLNTPTHEIGAGYVAIGDMPFASAQIDDQLKNEKIVFLTLGEMQKRYVLDVWKFIKLKDQKKYEIGVRLFLVDQDKIVNQWSTVTYSPTYTKNGSNETTKKVVAGDQSVIVSFENGKEVNLQFQFQSTGTESRGNVNVKLSIDPAKGLHYNADFSDDYPYNLRNVLRFELTDEAFSKIVALPEFKQFEKDKAGLYDSDKISFTLNKLGETDIVFLRPAENNTEVSSVGRPFFRSEVGREVKPGFYTFEMKLDGYEDVKIDSLLISWGDLSMEDADIQTTITKLKLNNLKSDPCGQCATIQACTVCMDHQIIQRYTKATP